jgi:hypothetical protein
MSNRLEQVIAVVRRHVAHAFVQSAVAQQVVLLLPVESKDRSVGGDMDLRVVWGICVIIECLKICRVVRGSRIGEDAIWHQLVWRVVEHAGTSVSQVSFVPSPSSVEYT